MPSPYSNKKPSKWNEITENLVEENPISSKLVDMCLKTWQSILNGKINSFLNLTIKDMSLSPQAVSNLFHAILPEYIQRNSTDWKKGSGANEKDVVCALNSKYSFKIKISSSKNSIFGNRSYGQRGSQPRKPKDGYCLAINIDKLTIKNPQIRIIRFGWLDDSDWISQRSQTGQQARLNIDAMKLKFKTLYQSQKNTQAKE